MRTMESPVNELLTGLKRFTQAKKTGVVGKGEFPGLYEILLRLIANCFRNGKLSYEDNELIESINSQLVDEKIYPNHQGLNDANNGLIEELSVIFYERERFGTSMGLKR